MEDNRVEAYISSKDNFALGLSIEKTIETLDRLSSEHNDKIAHLYSLILRVLEANGEAKVVGNPCGERSILYEQKSRILESFVKEAKIQAEESPERCFKASWTYDRQTGVNDHIVIIVEMPDNSKKLYIHNPYKISELTYCPNKTMPFRPSNLNTSKRAIETFLINAYGFEVPEKQKKEKDPVEQQKKREERNKRKEERRREKLRIATLRILGDEILSSTPAKPKKYKEDKSKEKPQQQQPTNQSQQFKTNISSDMSPEEKFKERFSRFKKPTPK